MRYPQGTNISHLVEKENHLQKSFVKGYGYAAYTGGFINDLSTRPKGLPRLSPKQKSWKNSPSPPRRNPTYITGIILADILVLMYWLNPQIPGSSRYVKFLPFGRFFLGRRGTNPLQKRKIQVWVFGVYMLGSRYPP